VSAGSLLGDFGKKYSHTLLIPFPKTAQIPLKILQTGAAAAIIGPSLPKFIAKQSLKNAGMVSASEQMH